MIDNGYLFARDNKRIFINTSLGCAGQCAYCYLPKMGYSNSSYNYKTISAQRIIDFIEQNNLSHEVIKPMMLMNIAHSLAVIADAIGERKGE